MMLSPAVTVHTDSELIARVLAGERGDFESLVRRHNQRLYRAARAITHSDADAEDVLQQAWLNVFRQLSQFRGEAAFSTWATRITVHEAIATVRRRPTLVEVRDELGDQMPDDPVARAQIGKLLEHCLNSISQGNREVMVLRDLLELDTAETASCLGLSEEAVRVRLHRARAAMATAINDRLTGEAHELYGFDGARCDRIRIAVMTVVMGGQ